MTLYILKSAIIIGILLAVYHLFMEREKMHRFNRFYLLSGLGLALITPLITVGHVNPETSATIITSAPIIINEIQSNVIHGTSKGLDWMIFIWLAYSVISLIMLLRFFNNIGILLLKSIRNPKIYKEDYTLVLIEEHILPHTFLKYIYINRLDYESNNIEPELIIHESTHARQWHTADILLIELIHVFFWFNPLISFYKRAIQLNHEFLADEAVVLSTAEVQAYQHLLLDKASASPLVGLASNLNFLVTKKRLRMMTQPISRRRNLFYGLMVFPLSLFLVSCFGDYDTSIIENSRLIQRDGEVIAVDFRKMNQLELETVATQLKEFNIEVSYNDIEYGSSGYMRKFTVKANFNTGHKGSASFDCEQLTSPYGIWMDLESGANGFGWPEDFEVSNPLVDSPYSRPISDSYIDYINKDKFSVNFKGMNKDQVKAVQKEVERTGINLFYNKLGFNPAGAINMIQFTFEMGDNSRGATMAFTASQLNNSPPFGFWINKETGTSGTGTLDIEQNITKAILYDEVPSKHFKDASFFIENQKASFDEIKNWLLDNNWISNSITHKHDDQIFRFTSIE